MKLDYLLAKLGWISSSCSWHRVLHSPKGLGVHETGGNSIRWKAVTFEGDGVHPKRLHQNHQIEIRALNVTMPAGGARVLGWPARVPRGLP